MVWYPRSTRTIACMLFWVATHTPVNSVVRLGPPSGPTVIGDWFKIVKLLKSCQTSASARSTVVGTKGPYTKANETTASPVGEEMSIPEVDSTPFQASVGTK